MEKKTSKNIWLIIMGVLILAELAASVIHLINGGNVLNDVIAIIALAFTALYGFWLYKKPHGNMLKYAMLLLAAAMVLNSAECLIKGYNAPAIHVIRLFFPGLICYVAGRLNRIEQNKYLLIFATICYCIISFISFGQKVGKLNAVLLFRFFYEFITLLTLTIAYFVRFKEHKEAGLMDAPKK